MKRFLLLIALLLTLHSYSTAQNSAVKEIQRMALEDNRTMQHLDILCNRIGGRPAGSEACQNAEEWTAHRFKEWGFEVSVEKVGEIGVGFNRGGW